MIKVYLVRRINTDIIDVVLHHSTASVAIRKIDVGGAGFREATVMLLAFNHEVYISFNIDNTAQLLFTTDHNVEMLQINVNALLIVVL